MVRWQTGGQRVTDGAFRAELHLIDIPVGLGWGIGWNRGAVGARRVEKDHGAVRPSGHLSHHLDIVLGNPGRGM